MVGSRWIDSDESLFKSKFPPADEAFSFHTGLMLRLFERDYEESLEKPESIGYDAFISHASEDKQDFVGPLANALRVWDFEFGMMSSN